MTKKRTNKKSKSLFYRLAHFHLKVASFGLIFYLMLGMIVDPRFLAYDFRQKYSAIASSSTITVSMRVMGEPEKPVLTAVAGWEAGVSFIDLSWNDTEDTETYDLYRDSLPLITGLTGTSYRDTNIEKNTFYDYKILAKGPLGETFSDEIHIFSGDHEIYETPECLITTISGKAFTEGLKITNRVPEFTGTTNIENALIAIEISGAKNLIATTTANSNGYWSWITPENLLNGTYTILVTAVDPNNSLISAQVSKTFEIVKEKSSESDDEEDEKKETKTIPPTPTTPPTKIVPPEKPIEHPTVPKESSLRIFVYVENENKLVYSNDDLIVHTKIATTQTDFENKNVLLRYTITDEKNTPILDFSEKTNLSKNKIVERKIPISDLFPAGKYKIMVRTEDNDRVIMGEDFFSVKEYYLVSIGSLNISLTQIMQSLSWIILFLFLLILFFLLMLTLEKYLALQAKRQITEYFLAKRGYFGKRKGVQK